MMIRYRFPLVAGNQTFTTTIAGQSYHVTLVYRSAELGGWFLDVERSDGSAKALGIQVVLGQNLLAQHEYLGFGKVYVEASGIPREVLDFSDISSAVLVWEV